jgi:hypothetical protein
MRSSSAVILFPFLIAQFIFEHPWMFVGFLIVSVMCILMKKTYWHND